MSYLVIPLDIYLDYANVNPDPKFVQVELTDELVKNLRTALAVYTETFKKLGKTSIRLHHLAFTPVAMKTDFTFLYGEDHPSGVYAAKLTDDPADVPEEPIEPDEIYAEFQVDEEIRLTLSFGGSEYFCDLPIKLFKPEQL